jgi:hypothetical protein
MVQIVVKLWSFECGKGCCKGCDGRQSLEDVETVVKAVTVGGHWNVVKAVTVIGMW